MEIQLNKLIWKPTLVIFFIQGIIVLAGVLMILVQSELYNYIIAICIICNYAENLL